MVGGEDAAIESRLEAGGEAELFTLFNCFWRQWNQIRVEQESNIAATQVGATGDLEHLPALWLDYMRVCHAIAETPAVSRIAFASKKEIVEGALGLEGCTETCLLVLLTSFFDDVDRLNANCVQTRFVGNTIQGGMSRSIMSSSSLYDWPLLGMCERFWLAWSMMLEICERVEAYEASATMGAARDLDVIVAMQMAALEGVVGEISCVAAGSWEGLIAKRRVMAGCLQFEGALQTLRRLLKSVFEDCKRLLAATANDYGCSGLRRTGSGVGVEESQF
jgi:hypothetical protein